MLSARFGTWHIVGLSNCRKKKRIFSRPCAPFVESLSFFIFSSSKYIINPGYFAFLFNKFYVWLLHISSKMILFLLILSTEMSLLWAKANFFFCPWMSSFPREPYIWLWSLKLYSKSILLNPNSLYRQCFKTQNLPKKKELKSCQLKVRIRVCS